MFYILSEFKCKIVNIFIIKVDFCLKINKMIFIN